MSKLDPKRLSKISQQATKHHSADVLKPQTNQQEKIQKSGRKAGPKNWSKKEDQIMRELGKKGLNCTQMQFHFPGRTKEAIRSHKKMLFRLDRKLEEVQPSTNEKIKGSTNEAALVLLEKFRRDETASEHEGSIDRGLEHPATEQKSCEEVEDKPEKKAKNVTSNCEKWTDEQDWLIMDIAGQKVSDEALSAMFPGRSVAAIAQRRRDFGLGPGQSYPNWTDTENQRLSEIGRPNLTDEELEELFPGRTLLAVQAQMRRLGLSFNRKFWAPSEDKVMIDAAEKGLTFPEMWKLLPDRSENGLRKRLVDLGITLKHEKKRWTSEEDQAVLNGNKEGLTSREIAEQLPDRTDRAVERRLQILGVTCDQNREDGKLHYWTDEENEKLKNFIRNGIDAAQEVEKVLPGRSIKAIGRHLMRLSTREQKDRKPWTPEEDAKLEEAIQDQLTYDEIEILLPGRSLIAICVRKCELKKKDGAPITPGSIGFSVPKPYIRTSPEEDEKILRGSFEDLEDAEIAKLVDRGLIETRKRLAELLITRGAAFVRLLAEYRSKDIFPKVYNIRGKQPDYCPEEDEQLVRFYFQLMTWSQIGKILGRAPGTIQRRFKKLQDESDPSYQRVMNEFKTK